MIEVSPGRASHAGEQITARGWLVRLLSDRHIRVGVAAAILMLGGGITMTRSAYAQDTASCIDKCKAEQKQCLHNGSSEELCEYDSKQCQKACSQGK
jgi:hypothetical protein